jgi:hypothetical protein
METTAKKTGQPWWIWALIGVGALMGLVMVLVFGGIFALAAGKEPLPAAPAELGEAEAALSVPAAEFQRLQLWPADEGRVATKFTPVKDDSNVSFFLSRSAGLERPFTMEGFSYMALNGWAGRKIITYSMLAQGGKDKKETKKDLPPLGRQGYDAYQICNGDACNESIFVGSKASRVYLLVLKGQKPLLPSDNQALADVMEAALDRMAAYAKEHPATKK